MKTLSVDNIPLKEHFFNFFFCFSPFSSSSSDSAAFNFNFRFFFVLLQEVCEIERFLPLLVSNLEAIWSVSRFFMVSCEVSHIFFASFSLLFHILHNYALNKGAKYLFGNEHLRQVRQFTILKKSAVTSFEDTEGYIKGGHEERKDMAGKKKCWHSIEAKRKTCTHRKQFCYSDKTFIALKANTII